MQIIIIANLRANLSSFKNVVFFVINQKAKTEMVKGMAT